MAARRCSIDGISFPTGSEYYKCPVCGESTSYISDEEPDEYWQWAATLLIERRNAGETEPPDIPTVPADVRVRVENDQMWIHSWDLHDHDVKHRLRPDDLIRVGKQAFEVILYVDSRREYLVRPFSLELSDDDLRRLACPD